MNFYTGIVFGVLGLVLTVLGLLGILPDMGTSGIYLFLLGGLVIGLSFVPKPEPDNVMLMPFWERIVKMFYSPSEVFRNLKSHPRWIIAILIVAIFSAAYTTVFFYQLTPERITIETMGKLSESGFFNEEQLALIKQQTLDVNLNPIKPLGDFVNSFVGWSFFVAFLALIFFVGILAFGGQISYLQSFAVAAYSMLPVTVVQKSISMIMLFLKDPIDIHPIIGQTTLVVDNLSFLVSAGERPVVYTILGGFSLLMFYRVWLMSLGLRVTGEKVSSATSWIISGFIWILYLSIGVIGATLFGNFLG